MSETVNETIEYVNERPEIPVETEDVKYEVKEVSRSLKTTAGETKRVKYVLTPIAKTVNGALNIVSGKLEDFMTAFNDGYFAKLRGAASNELAGGSAEDKAFARIAKVAMNLPLFAGKSEEEVANLLRENPAFMALFSK